MAGHEKLVFSVTPDPQPAPATKFGLHVHHLSDLDKIEWMAGRGYLAGVTVLNDIDFVNKIAPLVPYPVLRIDPTGQNSVQGFVEYGAHPKVIYQFGNEANQTTTDLGHWLDIMHEADSRGQGRKVAIITDGVGITEDRHWFYRWEALAYAKEHGHYVSLHSYGDVTTGTWHPNTAWDSPDAFRWFGGRFIHLYSLVHPTKGPVPQPMLILTEWGGGGYQKHAGFTNWNRDRLAFDEIAKRLPYVASYNAWTTGGGGPDRFPGDQDGMYQFRRDSLDDPVSGDYIEMAFPS